LLGDSSSAGETGSNRRIKSATDGAGFDRRGSLETKAEGSLSIPLALDSSVTPDRRCFNPGTPRGSAEIVESLS
jgi:hypothetical protein